MNVRSNSLQPGIPSHKRIFCNRCRAETNHFASYDHVCKHEEEQSDSPYVDKLVYRLWICAGCDSPTLESYSVVQRAYGSKANLQYVSLRFIPQRTNFLLAEKSYRRLPKKLDKIYKETIRAFNGHLFVLCAARLRALIEGICDNKSVKGKNLEHRINNLVGILPSNIVASLHSFRFMGNEALHELTAPNPDDLQLAIEVSEDLLNFLYELDYKASLLTRKQQGSQNPGGG